jgi:hypothetical protein
VGIQIGIHGLILAFAIGAAALALWLDTRIPRLAPKSAGIAFFHVIAAAIGCDTAHFGISAFVSRGTIAGMMAALFLVALPVILYVWLSLLWMTKLVTTELKSRYG